MYRQSCPTCITVVSTITVQSSPIRVAYKATVWNRQFRIKSVGGTVMILVLGVVVVVVVVVQRDNKVQVMKRSML